MGTSSSEPSIRPVPNYYLIRETVCRLESVPLMMELVNRAPFCSS